MGAKYKADFNRKAKSQERAVSFYNNIITNRHSVAHGSGSTVTVLELERFYQEGHVVLDFFRETLFSVIPIQQTQ